jgi:biotin operon repressor
MSDEVKKITGFIKLNRQIFDWQWYTHPDTCRMFMHLLLKANHKEALVKGSIKVERGQTITSTQRLSDELDISFSKVRKSLANLKSTGEIQINTSTKLYSMVTISKYNEYQGIDVPKTTNKKTTDNFENSTNKNDNNDIENIINISLWQNNYLENNRILESVTKNQGITLEFLKKCMVTFIKTQRSVDHLERSTKDFNYHFLNYIRKIKSSIGNKNYGRGLHNKTSY